MLLAAGLSTRMRPLTNDIPKPLLPFLNRRLLDFTLGYLQKFGIDSVAINVHHGREPFLQAIRDYAGPLRLQPFLEKEKILGTGGGIKNMRPFVTDSTFLVTNCDFLTDADAGKAIDFHRRNSSIATMVLIDDPRSKLYGEVGVDDTGRIVEFPHGKRSDGAKRHGFFSGIHIFDRAIFDWMPDREVFCINRDVYAPLVERKGSVYGFVTPARWYDLGEIASYRQAQEELKTKPLK